MTVAAQNVAPQAVAAPGQTIFPFAWRCDDAARVLVWVNDVQDGGFAVALNADQIAAPGGTITRGVACLGGEVVTVERSTPLTQTTNLTQYAPFPASTITNVLDYVTELIQEISAAVLNKCVKAGRSQLSKFLSLELPAPKDQSAIVFQADPISGKFTLAALAAATKEYLENYVQQVLSGGGIVQPVSWVVVGDDINTDFTIAGAVLNAPELYRVTIQGAVQEPTAAYTIDAVAQKIKFTGIPPLNARVHILTLGYAKGAPVTDTMSADRGDANVAVTPGADYVVQRFATALTANRTVTLNAGRVNGDKFRVVRTGLGAFTLSVGGLKVIPAGTAAFVDVMWDGAAWRLTAYGTL